VNIQTPEPVPRPGRSLFLRGLLGALVVTLFIGVAVATAVVLEIKDDVDIYVDNNKGIPHVKDVLDGVTASGPQTILVLGSDHRYADGKKAPSRSDTMLLIRLDPDNAATTVMSIPRDLQVTIPGVGIAKLNAAYEQGGPKLTVKMLKKLLGTTAHPFKINHVVNINFDGFTRLLTKLGCVYIDSDRHYFNDNNPPAGGGSDYATINVKAGYQQLCGQKGLDYVRYRHFDDDLVRAARQQDFLRQAKDQIGLTKVFDDRKELLKLFAQNTQSDLTQSDEVYPILKLMLGLIGKPVQQVQFPGIEGPSYVTYEEAPVKRAVHRFMNAQGNAGSSKVKVTKKSRKKRKKDKKREQEQSSAIPEGLIENAQAGQDVALPLATRAGFPVYYPTLMGTGASYSNDSHAYHLFTPDKKRRKAYRIVVSSGEIGQYYGIQGTTWRTPPILSHPTGETRMAGRTYKLFGDGKRLRLVSWKTPRAVYWVSNTLLSKLSNKQMLGIARSVRRFS
jgi:polyisoprenyl-teichoic acid--peptidoglycan teichoic acid transferase